MRKYSFRFRSRNEDGEPVNGSGTIIIRMMKDVQKDDLIGILNKSEFTESEILCDDKRIGLHHTSARGRIEVLGLVREDDPKKVATVTWYTVEEGQCFTHSDYDLTTAGDLYAVTASLQDTFRELRDDLYEFFSKLEPDVRREFIDSLKTELGGKE